MSDKDIRSVMAIGEALRHSCGHGSPLVLVTPYMRFESRFLGVDGAAVYVAATMTKEEAQYGLKSSDLRIRFPYGYSYYEGRTSLIGLGFSNGKQALRLALPLVLTDDDCRGSYRTDRVGRVPVTFSSRKYDILSAGLANVSTTGARIVATREIEEGDILVDDVIHVTIPIDPTIHINCQAKVRYLKDRTIGLEFRPKLSGAILDNLSEWIFQRKEEQSAQAMQLAGPNDVVRQDGLSELEKDLPGLVLVGGSDELLSKLSESLKDLPPLKRLPASIQTMKGIAATTRTLAMLAVGPDSLNEKKKLRLLIEAMGKVPFVLVGADVPNDVMFTLGGELKALAVYSVTSSQSSFLSRLLAGIYRKHFGLAV